ncbi:MAG TPA: DMT family transporter [Deltaproteobacteria bacterium]|jgi:drug/metabolite transporter (DMT)-like permease|nr:DMT family transporter [Deltaproteobacteria bacterium]HQI01046.1 DMT family transporter [Deltaproteobacteria bacterium]
MTPQVLGIIFALASAATWGTGDFSGGVASKSRSQYQVVFLMTIPGVIMLVLLAFLLGEPMPSVPDMIWASAAGSCGAVGIASLYRGLALHNAAVVAPTAAAVGAGLPVAFSSLAIGLPETPKMLGFLLALTGIWFVSRPVDGSRRRWSDGLAHAVIAGAGFGGYFILLAQVEQGMVFGPLTFAKSASLLLALAVLLLRRERIPALTGIPLALLAGVFDAGGNAFYMLARQYTRLDIAAVLASMYPAVTVMLASVILKEKVGTHQAVGVILCLIAIALISL